MASPWGCCGEVGQFGALHLACLCRGWKKARTKSEPADRACFATLIFSVEHKWFVCVPFIDLCGYWCSCSKLLRMQYAVRGTQYPVPVPGTWLHRIALHRKCTGHATHKNIYPSVLVYSAARFIFATADQSLSPRGDTCNTNPFLPAHFALEISRYRRAILAQLAVACPNKTLRPSPAIFRQQHTTQTQLHYCYLSFDKGISRENYFALESFHKKKNFNTIYCQIIELTIFSSNLLTKKKLKYHL